MWIGSASVLEPLPEATAQETSRHADADDVRVCALDGDFPQLGK